MAGDGIRPAVRNAGIGGTAVFACFAVLLVFPWSQRDYFKALPVPYYRQYDRNWCWAASGEMVMDYFRKHVRQCEQANKLFKSCACCDVVKPPECRGTGGLIISEYDFTSQRASLEWNDVRREIDSDRPIVSKWIYDNKSLGLAGGSHVHMTVTFGYGTAGGRHWVMVHDPADWDTWLYTEEAYSAGAGYWRVFDFYDIKRK